MSHDLERIAASKPINATAARVVSRGYQYQSGKRIQTADQDTPIAMRPVQPGMENLTGMRRGSLRVLGLAKGKAKSAALWVVRCDCGIYTTRRGAAIKNEKNDQDRCEQCRHLAYLKRENYKRRTGVWKQCNEL